MISLIIPTYKEPEVLDLCLESAILGQKHNNQIIVIVDGFYDLNKEVLEKHKDKIQILNLPENMGLTKATNLGVYNAQFDKILIVKGDKQYIPKGTKLYHGDIQYPFIPGSKSTSNKNNMTFFGLDIDIAIWYILELVEIEKFKKDNNFSRFGFLYIFVL